MKNIYLILGCSGSGKTTIVEALEQTRGLTSIQSYTTRPKRTDNEKGHIFVSDKEFDKLTDIVAFTVFCNNRYGATAEQVEHNDLYIIDPSGVKYFREKYTGSKGVKVIYIKTSLVLRMERLEKRDGFDEALKRIKNDIIEFKDAEMLADKTIINEEDGISDTVGKVWKYISQCEAETI